MPDLGAQSELRPLELVWSAGLPNRMCTNRTGMHRRARVLVGYGLGSMGGSCQIWRRVRVRAVLAKLVNAAHNDHPPFANNPTRQKQTMSGVEHTQQWLPCTGLSGSESSLNPSIGNSAKIGAKSYAWPASGAVPRSCTTTFANRHNGIAKRT